MSERANQKFAHVITDRFGVATLKWWRWNTPRVLDKAIRAGTIMDYFVALVARDGNIPISAHNAQSFGAWSEEEGWKIDDSLLPPVAADFPSFPVPHSSFSPNCVIIPAMGDHQCSVFAAGVPPKPNSLFFNFGTSAQMTIVATCRKGDVRETGAVEIRPFYKPFGRLLTVASLNGGNVIDHFISFFNQSHESILSEMENGSQEDAPVWKSVRLFPERGIGKSEKETSGVAIENLKSSHSPKNLIHSLSKGLVQNLFDLLNAAVDDKSVVQNLECCFVGGGAAAYVRPHITAYAPNLREIKKIEAIAAYGAALFVQYLNSRS